MPSIAVAMGQTAGVLGERRSQKWNAAAKLQPTFPKPDRLLVRPNQAVDEVMGRLTEATADESCADPDQLTMLMDYRRAARRLEAVYDKACQVELDLPPDDELVKVQR